MRGEGYVYVLQSLQHGWLKIGWARDIAARMVGLASQFHVDLTLLGCFVGTMPDETATQKRFVAHRVAHDWFHPHEELIAFAKGLASPIQISLVSAPTVERHRLERWLQAARASRRGPPQPTTS